MKKGSIIILMLLIITSCISEKEKLQTEALNAIRSSIENDAFRDNASVKFHTLELISMKKVNGSYIDEVYMNGLIEEADRYKEKAALEIEKANEYSNLMNASNMYEVKAKSEELLASSTQNLLNAKTFLNKARAIEKRIDTIQLDSLWKVKVFMKASFEHEREVDNILDTLIYVLNNNFQLQKFKELE